MPPTSRLTQTASDALLYLYQLAENRGGYERRGVRGWARMADIERTAGRGIGDNVHRLRARGMVQTDDVTPSPVRRAVLVYRITAAGIDALSAHRGTQLDPVDAPGEPGLDRTVYVPSWHLEPLHQLRRAWEEGGDSPYLPGERGWRTAAQLLDPSPEELEDWRRRADWRGGEWAEETAWGPDEPLPLPSLGHGSSLSLHWLTEVGWAQRWGVTPAKRKRPILLWRITPAGLAVTPLVWHLPAAST